MSVEVVIKYFSMFCEYGGPYIDHFLSDTSTLPIITFLGFIDSNS